MTMETTTRRPNNRDNRDRVQIQPTCFGCSHLKVCAISRAVIKGVGAINKDFEADGQDKPFSNIENLLKPLATLLAVNCNYYLPFGGDLSGVLDDMPHSQWPLREP